MSKRSVDNPASLGWEDNGDGFWSWSAAGGGSSFPEAPEDGSQYARQDADWSEVVAYDDTAIADALAAALLRIESLENAPPVDAYTKAESDGKYQLIGSYALVGASYTKAESDSKWQPAGNYSLVGASYTKSESDGAYVPKTGNTTINGTLTAKDMVATG